MANTYTYFERTAGSQHNNAADWNQINKNCAAIISSVGTAAPSEALDQKLSVTYVLNTASTATDKVFSANYVTDNFSTGASGGVSNQFIHRPAGSWDFPTSNPAPLDVISTTTEKFHAFDDTTEESVITQDFLEGSLDTTGRMVVHAWGDPKTPAASKNIQLKTYWYAYSTGDNYAGAWLSMASGDVAVTSSGTYDDYFTYGTSASVLDGKNVIRVQQSRIDATANDLTGDYRLKNWMLEIPRT